MPAYDYICQCGKNIQRVTTMKDMKKSVKCPACGKMAKRTIAMPSVIVRRRYLDRAGGDPRANRGRGY